MEFKYCDKLDIRKGDVIKINDSSIHIVLSRVRRTWAEGELFAVEGFTLLCDDYGYDDDMKVGQVNPLYLEEFLQRAEENSIEVLHRLHAIPITT